jgi:hypothetical protein
MDLAGVRQSDAETDTQQSFCEADETSRVPHMILIVFKDREY